MAIVGGILSKLSLKQTGQKRFDLHMFIGRMQTEKDLTEPKE
jgi:hypothetical protein